VSQASEILGTRRATEQFGDGRVHVRNHVAVQAIGNHIDVGVISLGSGLPLIHAGKLRLLGFAAPAREKGDAAEYPTVREQGLDVIADNPFTVVLPAGLSAEQIAFWQDALDKVVADPTLCAICSARPGRCGRCAIPKRSNGCRTNTRRIAKF
jgi:hypothetical protein